jgi:hypothetical protein
MRWVAAALHFEEVKFCQSTSIIHHFPAMACSWAKSTQSGRFWDLQSISGGAALYFSHGDCSTEPAIPAGNSDAGRVKACFGTPNCCYTGLSRGQSTGWISSTPFPEVRNSKPVPASHAAQKLRSLPEADMKKGRRSQ